jgi:hypothetical protein
MLIPKDYLIKPVSDVYLFLRILTRQAQVTAEIRVEAEIRRIMV